MNINDKVLVRLTPYAHAILVVNHYQIFSSHTNPPEYIGPPTRTDGWTEFSLWALMNEFGPYCYNGCHGQLFVNNEVILPK